MLPKAWVWTPVEHWWGLPEAIVCRPCLCHLEVLKQQQAAFTLTVVAVPATASEAQIVHLFEGFDVAEVCFAGCQAGNKTCSPFLYFILLP